MEVVQANLLDALVEALPEKEEVVEEELPRFAVVGRPNAGKIFFYKCPYW